MRRRRQRLGLAGDALPTPAHPTFSRCHFSHIFTQSLTVHEWAVRKLFYLHEIGAATGAKSSAFQPVFTRYKLLEMERSDGV